VEVQKNLLQGCDSVKTKNAVPLKNLAIKLFDNSPNLVSVHSFFCLSVPSSIDQKRKQKFSCYTLSSAALRFLHLVEDEMRRKYKIVLLMENQLKWEGTPQFYNIAHKFL
jgi:hypothetical protein